MLVVEGVKMPKKTCPLSEKEQKKVEGFEKDETPWVYSETVKDHFFHPRNIITNEEEIKKFNADGVGLVGSPACGDAMQMFIKVGRDKRGEEIIKDIKFKTFGCCKKGEIISTPNGFVSIEKIKMGDRILTHGGEEAYVEETSKRKIKGMIYTITPLVSKFNTLSLTEEHPLLAIKRKNLKFSHKQRHTSYFRVDNDILKKTFPEFIKLKELEKGDYLVYQPPMIIRDIKDIDSDELKLLGFYLSEGYLCAIEKSSNKFGVVAFSFNKNEEEYITELKGLLEKKFGKKPLQRIRGNVCEIYICSRNAVRFFDNYCGHMARNKKIHEDILYLPPEKQSIFLEYYFKGDGYLYKDKRKNRKDTYTMVTASVQLALQLQQLIARQGYFANISKRKTVPSRINGRLIMSKDSYFISFIKDKKLKSFVKKADSYFLIPIHNIVSEDYDDYVYNLQVSGENKSYLVKGLAVHNCATAIASTSMFSEMAKGKKIKDALKITPKQIADALGGIPAIKFHCSVLADQAFHAAVEDYYKKKKQPLK